jgi:hypothetical protein
MVRSHPELEVSFGPELFILFLPLLHCIVEGRAGDETEIESSIALTATLEEVFIFRTRESLLWQLVVLLPHWCTHIGCSLEDSEVADSLAQFLGQLNASRACADDGYSFVS